MEEILNGINAACNAVVFSNEMINEKSGNLTLQVQTKIIIREVDLTDFIQLTKAIQKEKERAIIIDNCSSYLDYNTLGEKSGAFLRLEKPQLEICIYSKSTDETTAEIDEILIKEGIFTPEDELPF
jgi:hypothetical protein